MADPAEEEDVQNGNNASHPQHHAISVAVAALSEAISTSLSPLQPSSSQPYPLNPTAPEFKMRSFPNERSQPFPLNPTAPEFKMRSFPNERCQPFPLNPTAPEFKMRSFPNERSQPFPLNPITAPEFMMKPHNQRILGLYPSPGRPSCQQPSFVGSNPTFPTFQPQTFPTFQGPTFKQEQQVDLKSNKRFWKNLCFGCMTKENTFYDLFRFKKAYAVDFGGPSMPKLQFLLRFGKVVKKLEWSYESLGDIEIDSDHNLVIQLHRAPLVYKTYNTSRNLNSFWDISQSEWDRDIDIDSTIGRSSAVLMMKLGIHQPSSIQKIFPSCKVTTRKLVRIDKVKNSPHNQDVIFGSESSDRGVQLQYPIVFLINKLIQNGSLCWPTLDDSFYGRISEFMKTDPDWTLNTLEKLNVSKEICYDPLLWLDDQHRNSKEPPKPPLVSLPGSRLLLHIRKLKITPFRIYFCGPVLTLSNRVLREFEDYADNFLRISFLDDDMKGIHSAALCKTYRRENRKTGIYYRFHRIIKNGIVIGDKKFEFLAFSNSQLKERSLWMFSATETLSASDIRQWMGNFSGIKNAAKYAARLGQSIGSSIETVGVDRSQIEDIDDIGAFSDGIGKISSDLAGMVASKCGCSTTPSAFQIRIGGYKGVVAVDPSSSNKLFLRKSMNKFVSGYSKLDVLAWSKSQPCYLNRQLIVLLSTRGIEDDIFIKKQRASIERLDTNDVDLFYPGEMNDVLKQLLICGYKDKPNDEPFIAMLLQKIRDLKLVELRKKARILIENGRSMMGCLDETSTLEYGEVFVQYSSKNQEKEEVLVADVVVAKNPCLHPGDLRVLRAVNVPALMHMVDCIVFPQKGERPHPKECSGSDLDWDIYFVCWDKELIPPNQEKPMDYTTQPARVLDLEVTIQDVKDFFLDYIINDKKGQISNTHLGHADKSSQKANCKECLHLAGQFSTAVDYAKTNVPAVLPSHLKLDTYPDFMEKTDKHAYSSTSILGLLWREVKDKKGAPFTPEPYYDEEMEVEGFEAYTEDALNHKRKYNYKLAYLMDCYEIKTEAEILIERPETECVNMAMSSLRKEARAWFDEKTTENSASEDEYAKASAWYHVTNHPDYFGLERNQDRYFLSFPWCVHDRLIGIKRKNRAG